MTPALLVTGIGMVIASVTDLRTGKIPNWLTGALLLVGLLFSAADGTVIGAATGIGAALLIHYPLWMMGVEKAGDAKLLMGVGALLHTSLMIETTIWCAVLYLPVGLLFLAAKGRLVNLWNALRWSALKAQGIDPGERPPPTMLRTAPIIAAATAAAVSTSWFDVL